MHMHLLEFVNWSVGGWKEEKGRKQKNKSKLKHSFPPMKCFEFRVSGDVSPRWFLQRFLKQQKKYEHLSRHFTEPVCVMSSPSLKSVRTCNRRRHISGPHICAWGSRAAAKRPCSFTNSRAPPLSFLLSLT